MKPKIQKMIIDIHLKYKIPIIVLTKVVREILELFNDKEHLKDMVSETRYKSTKTRNKKRPT